MQLEKVGACDSSDIAIEYVTPQTKATKAEHRAISCFVLCFDGRGWVLYGNGTLAVEAALP